MTLTDKPEKPDYMTDAQGRHVPIDLIDDADLLRDQTVEAILERAVMLQAQMRAFKQQAMSDVREFVDLSAERYNVKVGGQKGNITLTSYDGTRKVVVQVSENIRFDERIQAAKKLIDDCIHRWTADSSSEVKALVDHAFQADKEGNISISRILGLTRLKIDDGQWLDAMQAIRDSMQVIDTATYMRLYRRDHSRDQWTAIPLDIAKL
ncbi:DUF3164 family protein [Alloalcanivorax xenomutans]|uniref:DUF3164 family protein n=1 Tax=Alloalcanivorax xenomutans TaxID=1094342 RepID=A0A9Q3W764_9GAMM|nr:DUF3164 family protein [Alloalcanivorax xenomutans]MCE7510279.1 DUF3164 family protein [Alloalcanivorax xenomutans]